MTDVIVSRLPMNRGAVDQVDGVVNVCERKMTAGNWNAENDCDLDFGSLPVDDVEEEKGPAQNYLHEPANDCDGDFDAARVVRYGRHA